MDTLLSLNKELFHTHLKFFFHGIVTAKEEYSVVVDSEALISTNYK